MVPVLYLALNRLYGVLRPDVENVSSTLLRIVIDPRSWIPIFAFLLDLMRYGIGGPLAAFSNRIADPNASTYVATAIYLGALAVGVWIGTPRTRRQLAACLLLFVSCYALIAGGRVLFFVQAGTTLAQTPRYHYAGPVFPITALCVVAGQLSQRFRLPGSVPSALLLLLLAVLLGNRSEGDLGREQAAARIETANTIRSIRRQIDQTPSGQDVYIENQRFAALGKVNIEEWTPGWAAVFVIFFPENTVDGKRVFFVEPNLKVVQAAQRGTRSRTLLISPRPLPSAPPPAAHGQIPLGQQGAGTTGGSTVEVSRDGRFALAGR